MSNYKPKFEFDEVMKVLYSLCGPIELEGDANNDAEALENMKLLLSVAQRIIKVTGNEAIDNYMRDSGRASIDKSREEVVKVLKHIRSDIDCYLDDTSND